ncbi:uncharacterized protein TNCV_3221191 [Trichonephila clavipes]|nr:uncharacterized protein TNCV_3221191 [Trichonephila clavipes]
MVAEHHSSAWFEAEWKELDCKYEKDSCPVAEPKGLKCRTVFDVVRTGDESRFNLSSDYNCVRVWRPRGERLNPAFALQRHTAPTAAVMVWGVIA